MSKSVQRSVPSHREFRSRSIAVLLAACLLAGLAPLAPAWAEEVGTVAGTEGKAEVGRDGNWIEASIGMPVRQGDQLRTGRPGRIRVVFQDDSVLTLSDDSRVAVDEQVFDPKAGKAESLIDLFQGKLSAVVSEYYKRVGGQYQVRTPTAVCGVRGTEFTVEYDDADDVTDVIALSGQVEVRSIVDPTGGGVLIRAGEATSVKWGELPSAPERLDDILLRQRLEGIDFSGAGSTVGLGTGSGLFAGSSVPSDDRAGTSGGSSTVNDTTPQGGEHRDPSSLLGQSPPVVEQSSGQLGFEF
jgi:hypothetical protein